MSKLSPPASVDLVPDGEAPASPAPASVPAGAIVGVDAHEAPTIARARNAGCEYLATKFAHPADNRVDFDEAAHVYHYYPPPGSEQEGPLKFPVSATGLKDKLFNHFDPDKILNDEERWKRWLMNKTLKPELRDILDDGALSDAQKRGAIKARWSANGARSSATGTAAHHYMELMLNKLGRAVLGPVGRGADDKGDAEPEEDDEWQRPFVGDDADPDLKEACTQLQFAMAELIKSGWQPYRTEMTVYEVDGERPVAAGQIDALLRRPLDRDEGEGEGEGEGEARARARTDWLGRPSDAGCRPRRARTRSGTSMPSSTGR